jgi:hypothetical protein
MAALSLLALLAPQTAAAPAYATKLPAPTAITVVAHTDPGLGAALAGVPAQALPVVLAAVGTPFQIDVSLWNGRLPAAYTADTVVALTAPGPGQLGVRQATIPAGATSVTITTSYSAATADLTVTAGIPAAKRTLAGVTASFPIDLSLSLLDGQAAALRDGSAGADAAGCTTVDPAHPMCGTVALPRGAAGNVALSLGVCPTAQSCRAGGLVTQLIANMTGADGALYTRTAPARMTIVCDKSLCGQGGVPHYTALWSQSATGPLAPAPRCPAKGVIGDDQDFCTDTVASTRDRAGDLHLVVLFLDDVRGMI